MNHPSPNPERKPRCMRLVADKRGVNRCTSEQLADSDLCSRHLAQAVQDYREIVSAHTISEETSE